MGLYLEDEMRRAIYCDPNFVKNFLAVEKAKQAPLNKLLDNHPKNIQAKLDDSITAERLLYKPILSVLCSIKVREYSSTIPGDDPDTQLIKPDLVLFESGDRSQRQWATVMMPIEVKAKHTYLKVGMKQLTRYARAVFAHQIHRRHLYGMVICKWRATFVRFDRSGIVHSAPIDMLHNPKEFRQAFAGLMMMDRAGFGYDTSFTVEHAPEHRLEYYVDLPAVALSSSPNTGSGVELAPTTSGSDVGAAPDSKEQQQLPTRRFKVMERLCHRKSIRGRATVVLRIHEVQKCTGSGPGRPMTRRQKRLEMGEPKWEEILGQPDYVLKLMWRDPNKRQEGAILKRLEGEYGVVQCRWYSDVLQWGSSCHEPGAPSCDKCCDVTPVRTAVRQVKNLGDLDVHVRSETEGQEPQYVEVDTDDCIGELHAHRMARIHTWSLFSTVGRPLWTAESPYQFLEAVLDAVLGYWHTFNRGVLHRDISDGNVLIAEPGEGYHLHKWKSDLQPMTPQNQQASAHPLAESMRLAQEMVMQLGRDPSGFLSDYDLATTRDRMESEFFGQTCAQDAINALQTLDAEDVPNAIEQLRRDSDPTSPSPSMGTESKQAQSEEPVLSPIAGPGNKTSKQTDFRTGTPIFMSARILQVRIGERYKHHFMDDLESFFWLIIWCVIQHVDPDPADNGKRNIPTTRALELLDLLQAESDFTLAGAKTFMLIRCRTNRIQRDLEQCENSWADDISIFYVIKELGIYFAGVAIDNAPLSQYTPELVFPKIVGILSEALEEMRLSSQNPSTDDEDC